MNRPLILAAHGSESSAGRSSFARFVNAVRREAHDLEVHDAFVDVQEPDVASVIAETVGPRTIVPLMLSEDTPLAARVRTPAEVDPLVTVTPTLGPDWVLAEVGVQRLIEAGARSDDTIVLAADAVIDPRAVADIGKAARYLSAVWGGRVHVGLLGGPDTSVVDAVDIARAYNKRVVVSSYLFGDGRAHEAFIDAGADLVTAPLLDAEAPDPRLVSLVIARARSRSTSPNVAGF